MCKARCRMAVVVNDVRSSSVVATATSSFYPAAGSGVGVGGSGSSSTRVPLINIERGSCCSVDQPPTASGLNTENCVVGGATSGGQTNNGCRRCQTMLFHCLHCQQRCHKKCPGHTRPRRRTRGGYNGSSSSNNNNNNTGSMSGGHNARNASGSYITTVFPHHHQHRIYTGDEHWTKVLQANDTTGKLFACPYHGKTPDVRSLKQSAAAQGQGQCQSAAVTSQHKQCVRRRSSGLSSGSGSRCSPTVSPKKGRKGGSGQDAGGEAGAGGGSPVERTVFHALFDRFCQWLNETTSSSRRDSSSSPSSASSSLLFRLQLPSRSSRSSRRSSRDRCGAESQLQQPTSPPPPATAAAAPETETALLSTSPRRRLTRSEATCLQSTTADPRPSSPSSTTSSDDVESELRQWPATACSSSRCTSTCSSLTATSTSTACSDYVTGDVMQQDTITAGVEGEARSPRSPDQDAMCSTWPVANDDSSSGVQPDFHDVDSDSLHFHSELHEDSTGFTSTRSMDDQMVHDSLIDWNIPYTDLQFKDCIKSGVRCSVYSARWHGDVLVHTYCNLSDSEKSEFLRDVANLSRIRHENVCLFMGACLQAPTQAIITSELKGTSLYDRLHLSADKLQLRSRVTIARQVAQALGYLHAKGIAARCLSSRNVYLDPKVKLSVLDHAVVDSVGARVNCLSLPRGALCYLAPEVLRSLRPIVYRTTSSVFTFNTQTDIFAFGTLLYELVSGEFPWKGLRPEEILWFVSNGRRQPLVSLGCNSVLKVLIERCWTHSPEERPDFSEINHELQNKTGLHKRHSTSQPARLDRYGSTTSRTFCIK